MESFRAHDDSVSCLLWLQKGILITKLFNFLLIFYFERLLFKVYFLERLLISGGWDGVVRVWGNVGRTGQALRGLKAEFDHDGNITVVNYRYIPSLIRRFHKNTRSIFK